MMHSSSKRIGILLFTLTVISLTSQPAVSVHKELEEESHRNELQQAISESDLVERLTNLYEGWMKVQYPQGGTREQILQIKRPYVDKADELLTSYVSGRLNARHPAQADLLQQDIDKALTAAQMRTVFSSLYDEETKKSARLKFGLSLQNETEQPQLYVIAYSVGWGNVFHCVIRAFARRNGKFARVQRLEAEAFENTILRAFHLRSFIPGELRFLAFGTSIGSPRGFLNVGLFGFDGRNLKTFWQRARLPRGEVSVSEDKIILYWFDDRGPKPLQFTREIYVQEPKGLKLERIEHGLVR
jgi:hypothetical protein